MKFPLALAGRTIVAAPDRTVGAEPTRDGSGGDYCNRGLSRKLASLAAVVLAVTSTTVGAYEKLPRALAALSPADFAQQVEIVDDPLEPAVVLSTREGYARSRSIAGARANDVHLRALVDRGTGKVTWQVWHELVYVGGPREVRAVHYFAGGAQRRAEPAIVEHRLDECPPTDGVGFCNQFTQVAFELPEATAREIAESYRKGGRAPWRLRFQDANGRIMTGGLAPAEAAGLVRALDAWRERAGHEQAG